MIMKMKLKMKNRWHRYDINKPRPRHEHKYVSKYKMYKMYLSIMMALCIKLHLSNIWSWICEKVEQHWGWVEKKALVIKKACIRVGTVANVVW